MGQLTDNDWQAILLIVAALYMLYAHIFPMFNDEEDDW